MNNKGVVPQEKGFLRPIKSGSKGKQKKVYSELVPSEMTNVTYFNVMKKEMVWITRTRRNRINNKMKGIVHSVLDYIK